MSTTTAYESPPDSEKLTARTTTCTGAPRPVRFSAPALVWAVVVVVPGVAEASSPLNPSHVIHPGIDTGGATCHQRPDTAAATRGARPSPGLVTRGVSLQGSDVRTTAAESPGNSRSASTCRRVNTLDVSRCPIRWMSTAVVCATDWALSASVRNRFWTRYELKLEKSNNPPSRKKATIRMAGTKPMNT